MELGKCTFIDLTHTLHEKIPNWTGTCGFTKKIISDYDKTFKVLHYSMDAGIGTHIDAASHIIPHATDIAHIPLADLVVPAIVVDVTKHAHANTNYLISCNDINKFEKRYGKIPPRSLILGCTGWYKKWTSIKQYRNEDNQGHMHFPGFSVNAIHLLLERNIVGIGIDTFSPDGSNSTFPVHHAVLGAEKYILENLSNIDKLPPTGAFVIVAPLKISGGTESPVRVIGIIE